MKNSVSTLRKNSLSASLKVSSQLGTGQFHRFLLARPAGGRARSAQIERLGPQRSAPFRPSRERFGVWASAVVAGRGEHAGGRRRLKTGAGREHKADHHPGRSGPSRGDIGATVNGYRSDIGAPVNG